MFRGKRGMSPLVLTIFLIAIFISAGAVVMSLGKNYITGGPGCSQLSLMLQEDQLCYDNQKINFGFENIGIKEVTGFDIQIEGERATIGDLIDVKLSKGTIYQSFIPFSSEKYGVVTKVTFTPVYKGLACTDATIILSGIPKC